MNTADIRIPLMAPMPGQDDGLRVALMPPGFKAPVQKAGANGQQFFVWDASAEAEGPYRQPVNKGAVAPNVKDGELQLACDAHVRIFDLSKAEDLRDYQAVFQLMAKGHAKLSAEERQYDADTKSWRVFLRWAQLYQETAKEAARG